MREASFKELKAWLPPRRPDAHKGDHGHVLLVAGSRGMAGAAVLAARAALRAGCGLLTAAVPESQQAVVSLAVPEALTLGLPQTHEGALRAEAAGRIKIAHGRKPFTLLAVGPGLGTDPETARALIGLLSLPLPAVVDADALNLIAREPRAEVRLLLSRRRAEVVFTPHPGELGRLLGRTREETAAQRADSAAELARAFGCVCLLKGRRTIVTDGASLWVNPTGNAGLAKAGTGDVLTGMIAGLWAQAGRGGFEAASLGAYLHGLAADRAVKRLGRRALLASDVIDALPEALARSGLA